MAKLTSDMIGFSTWLDAAIFGVILLVLILFFWWIFAPRSQRAKLMRSCKALKKAQIKSLREKGL